MSLLRSRHCTAHLRSILKPCKITVTSPRAEMASLKRKGDALKGSSEDLKRPKKDGSLTSFFGAPKPAAPTNGSTHNGSVPDPAPVKFDKHKWASSLKPELRELLKLEIDTLDDSWLAQLKEELVSPEFLNLKRFLQREIDSKQTIFPPLEDVYSWYAHTHAPTYFQMLMFTLH